MSLVLSEREYGVGIISMRRTWWNLMAPCRVAALINQGAHSMAPIMIIHADDGGTMLVVVMVMGVLLKMMVVGWPNQNWTIVVR